MTPEKKLHARLRRLRRDKAPARVARVPEGREVDPPAELVEVRGASGRFAARTTHLAPDATHGDWRLDEVDAVEASAFTLTTSDAALWDLDPRRALYLDIETTGLSGGAGTTAFLVALGSFHDDGGFELWQGFLRGPEEEPALLADVAARVDAAPAVVSFFGKSFDRHRLEDKMRVFGIEPPFASKPHLDLYHPLARLYRESLVDGRLATVESALCGVRRADDLPGAFAPEAWFDYLAGRAHRLEAVFQHNADDVLSLVVLAAHLGRIAHERRADERPLEGCEHARARGLARLFAARREREPALAWAERALERTPASTTVDDLRRWRAFRADLLRLMGRVEDALAAYEELVDEAEDELAARCCLEIAKLAEHRLRDAERASVAVHRARRTAERHAREPARTRLLRDAEGRLARLSRRLDRNRS